MLLTVNKFFEMYHEDAEKTVSKKMPAPPPPDEYYS